MCTLCRYRTLEVGLQQMMWDTDAQLLQLESYGDLKLCTYILDVNCDIMAAIVCWKIQHKNCCSV